MGIPFLASDGLRYLRRFGIIGLPHSCKHSGYAFPEFHVNPLTADGNYMGRRCTPPGRTVCADQGICGTGIRKVIPEQLLCGNHSDISD